MATSAERLQQYEDLFNQSQAYNPAKFQQDFEKSYGETTGYNQDLINQQSQALGSLQSVAPELRQRYSQTLIKDPTLQRSLIAQARQAPIADYNTAVGLLGQRGQRYADILGKSLSGYETSAQQAQTAAENAWRLYQDQLAQEQAARAAAASSGPSLADIINSITGGGAAQGGDLDITVPDTVKKGTNWTDKGMASDWFGADLSQPSTSTGSGVLKALQLANPLTYPKSLAGFAGNLWGNRKQDNMSFIDKLFNRR